MKRLFNLIELLIMIAVLAILFSLLSPSIQKIQASANNISCKNNMKSIAIAKESYQFDHQDFFPNDYPVDVSMKSRDRQWFRKSWQWLLSNEGYLNNSISFICPTDPNPKDFHWWRWHPPEESVVRENGSSYITDNYTFYANQLFGVGVKGRDIEQPSTYNFIADGAIFLNRRFWDTLKLNHNNESIWKIRVNWDHSGEINFLKGDGHIESQLRADVLGLRSMRNNPWFDFPINLWDTGSEIRIQHAPAQGPWQVIETWNKHQYN